MTRGRAREVGRIEVNESGWGEYSVGSWTTSALHVDNVVGQSPGQARYQRRHGGNYKSGPSQRMSVNVGQIDG